MSSSPVVEFVDRARRRRQWRSAQESLALGTAAALLALAAARLSASDDDASSASAWALSACAALSGLAMAGTWWVERAKKSELELAAQIDACLERDGALASAYEARVRGDANALALLAEERLAPVLASSSLRRALPPAGMVWLAPPALAAALFALALELPRERDLRGGPYAGAVLEDGGERATLAARSLLERARGERAGFPSDPAARARLAADLENAISLLDEVAASSPGTPLTLAADAGLRAELQAERDALAAVEKSLPSDPSVASGGPTGAPAPAVPVAGAGTEAEGNKSLLTNGASDRTMSGSNRPTADRNDARTSTHVPETGAVTEAGTLAGRWWDERHDPVVQGWRRALAARKEQR